MKKNKTKILIILISIFLVSGCTVQLKDEDKKVVRNETTGQNLVENILCRPTNEENIKLYEEHKVDIEKLPTCEEFSSLKGGYEGLWTNFIVKPISHIILIVKKLTNNAGAAIILTAALLRLILFPVSLKTAEQSENIKKARPELDALERKYKDKTDTDSIMKKSREMSLIYKKHNISQAAGCVMGLVQIPLLFGIIESIQRIPALYEGTFLTMQLGTTFGKGIRLSNSYVYLMFLAIIGLSTYYSFSFAAKDNVASQSSEMNMMANMAPMMTLMILVSGLLFPTATGLYWITSNMFTIAQNLYVERKKQNGN